jgi:hypothetical protein
MSNFYSLLDPTDLSCKRVNLPLPLQPKTNEYKSPLLDLPDLSLQNCDLTLVFSHTCYLQALQSNKKQILTWTKNQIKFSSASLKIAQEQKSNF